jgi:AcrR family transcriptional regulator
VTATELTPRGAATRQALVSAARALFVDGGYAAFSLRSVAKACQISLGHLQHFFPTKGSLVYAMLDEAAAEYARVYEGFLASPEISAQDRLRAAVTYLIEDAWNDRTTRFFVEFWSVTGQDEGAQALLSKLYLANRGAVQRFIADARPELTEAVAAAAALQIIALADGFMLYVYSERPDRDSFAAMASSAVEGAMAMVRAAGPLQI